MNILQLLANDGFICVNKNLIKQLGLEEAVLIGELASMYIYNQSKNLLEDDWFYATVKRIQENTGLSDYKQQIIIKKLVNLSILQFELRERPAKRFLRFNKHKLIEIFMGNEIGTHPKIRTTPSENSDNTHPKIRTTPSENSDNIYNNNYNNTNNNTYENTGGGISNKNNTTEILEENITKKSEQSDPPHPTPAGKVLAPKISPVDRIPKSVLGKLVPWNDYPDTLNALRNYVLFLLDTYGDSNASINNKITHICRMAGNSAKGIEIICNYNIDRNYRDVFKPTNYKKQLADVSAISEENKEEFVRDENGNIEEIW